MARWIRKPCCASSVIDLDEDSGLPGIAEMHLLRWQLGRTVDWEHLSHDEKAHFRTRLGEEPESAPVATPTAGASPAARFVAELIDDAARCGASDIHLESQEDTLRVRFRQDGHLRVTRTVGREQKAEILNRVKIMAQLDIAEKRRPQDGRIRVFPGGRSLDIRVSTLPTEHGEKIVMRLLDRSAVELDLGKLGFDQRSLDGIKSILGQPYGMLLITGPTGAGKTTTLYSALKHVQTPALNISTIEDPIEYRIEGVNQTATKNDIGLTFAHALRTLLRQDPNVLMVGEIRDRETADIAVRAALTGHLLLSTLHTNDAPSAIARMVDIGVEPFLLASALSGIVSQRLVRRVCAGCVVPDTDAARWLSALQSNEDPNGFVRGAGCSKCGGTGYRGRMGLFEYLHVDDTMRAAIPKTSDANELRALAVANGMVRLRDDGIAKARQCATSLEEIVRETCQ